MRGTDIFKERKLTYLLFYPDSGAGGIYLRAGGIDKDSSCPDGVPGWTSFELRPLAQNLK
ncbi:unnamed protein product [marine sediment metagenome]|uniref:Uncharacterized protein n=1 Tax=marine sediment metagenome TaxID=412755 RepID=X0UP28_9ZZZZ